MHIFSVKLRLHLFSASTLHYLCLCLPRDNMSLFFQICLTECPVFVRQSNVQQRFREFLWNRPRFVVAHVLKRWEDCLHTSKAVQKNGGWEILSSEYDFFYQMVYCQFRDGSSHPSCQCADWNKTIKTKLPCKRFCAVLKIQHQMEWFEPIAQKPLHIKSRRDLPEPISSSIPGQSSGTRKGKLGLYLIVDL
jgi:hypothetical protein